MRILHTSDWHLGQSFFGKSRRAEHQAFLDWLIEIIAKQQIDLLIVAGDIFDTGTPPSYARTLYNQFIVALQHVNCRLVIVAGNHDSVATLNESESLLACLNTHVVAAASDNLDKQVFCVDDRTGKAGAVICAVPFLRPRDMVLSEAGQSEQQKQQRLGDAIATHYQTLFEQAQTLAAQYSPALPIIMTGHLTTVGASTSDSVRDIYIGSLDAFNAHHFPAADYIALGHIHRMQKVAKTEHIRYSGSPIPLSFDELKQQKQLMLVEFDAAQTVISEIEIPTFQPLYYIKGDLASIKTELDNIDISGEQTIWLSVQVQAQDYLTDLQQRIIQLIDDRPIEVLQLTRQRNSQTKAIEQQHKETLAELDVQQVFDRRLASEHFEGEPEQQRLGRLQQLFSQVVNDVQSKEAE
ncbi:exonuclease subunit SbcD [Shewanella marina]|uniref:exonuclease subunit SbcD n=1 Tax=Shewanella marina TaxID=487319 RepID=UPI00047034DE|nr:exonuclease subunit SbcD [Shewanella marina]